MRIAKEFHFEAAHRLRFHRGHCRNLHGHSYKLVAEIEGKPASGPAACPDMDMVADFGTLKQVVHSVLFDDQDSVPFDHSVMLCVNDPLCQILEFEQGDETIGPLRMVKLTREPTAEYLAELLAGLIGRRLKDAYEGDDDPPQLTRVEVWETETSYAAWDASD